MAFPPFGRAAALSHTRDLAFGAVSFGQNFACLGGSVDGSTSLEPTQTPCVSNPVLILGYFALRIGVTTLGAAGLGTAVMRSWLRSLSTSLISKSSCSVISPASTR